MSTRLKRDNCHEANIKFIMEKQLGAVQIAECFSREEIDQLCIYLGIPNEELKELDTAQLLVEEVYKKERGVLAELRQQYKDAKNGVSWSEKLKEITK